MVLVHAGLTSLIAHIRVGEMQVALEAKSTVFPAVGLFVPSLFACMTIGRTPPPPSITRLTCYREQKYQQPWRVILPFLHGSNSVPARNIALTFDFFSAQSLWWRCLWGGGALFHLSSWLRRMPYDTEAPSWPSAYRSACSASASCCPPWCVFTRHSKHDVLKQTHRNTQHQPMNTSQRICLCAVAEVPQTEAAVGRELDHRLLQNKTRYRNDPVQNG